MSHNSIEMKNNNNTYLEIQKLVLNKILDLNIIYNNKKKLKYCDKFIFYCKK